ncbi:iron-containing alcohol dehydrogenase [Chelativorans sp. Marseille-P2723]|uniref:iron-containing alcohol dehydrogenase family protein n=1 Tax=Chelativorans sp. Marseille-P2723 TaxID=2709133 RepID=UPI00156D47D6|nr:iron-containing alcohol dehydrogenase [Chelativorans sp. Marseille-P2723]
MSAEAMASDAAEPPQTGYWTNYTNTGSRVILWPDAIEAIPEEIAKLGCCRLMVLCGRSTRRSRLFQRIVDSLGKTVVALVDDVKAHTPREMVMRTAALAQEKGCDGFLAIGGGSASDTAKAISIVLAEGGDIADHASRFVPPDQFYPKELHEPKLPVISVPTTASAAEVTPGLGVRGDDGKKMLFWDVKVASRLIVLDPRANTEIPADLMAQTAMNAFAHCVEGLYSRLRNPISEALALQGIRVLHRAIPAMVENPDDEEYRGGVLAGAHLSGMVISNARVGVHHALCHSLGGYGGLGHGEANSIMLPFAMAYNLDTAASELAQIAEAMGISRAGSTKHEAAEAAIEAVRELQRKARVPMRLRETSLDRAKLPQIAQHTLLDRGIFFNPRRTENADELLNVLEEAW